MGRLIHLSDLHFGRDRPELIDPLVEACAALAPDLTVISGDLTQRALAPQWAAAVALIRRLPGPVISVPGNHDVPLYNPLARLFWPFHGYRRSVATDLEPIAETADLRVIGMNTTDPLVWQRGLVRPASLQLATDRLRAARPGQLRLVVLHHPLTQPPETGKAPMKGAGPAAEALAEAGADVILTGHLHQWAADPFALRKGGRQMVCVQAGTTLSTRLRGEENDFNVIDHHAGEVTVTRHVARGDSTRFVADRVTRFHQVDSAAGWQHIIPLPGPLDAQQP
ncbi:metallophosphoesterase family protein [Tabrizicola sp.]|uniref:metallophosphoesterase family protein n=1 Tax=Tabrizicola sp. TaxID=2005166 RepID=UPI003F38109B